MKMKKLISVLVLFIASYLWGQNLPTVVDNSSYFPKSINQKWSSCGVVSLVYYLKSAAWNQKFNRDPSLLQNQFSAYAIWNQVINTTQHYSTLDAAELLMSAQGASTGDQFPVDIDNTEIFPDRQAIESGLSYRSSKLSTIWLYGQDQNATMNLLKDMKDSLKSGKCFLIHFPIYPYINQLYNCSPAVYNCYPGVARDSMIASHIVAIVGYDDTIKTAYGHGAFKLLNSWGTSFGDQGFFYLDYNWFYFAKWWGFTFFFLEENFNYHPELSLNLQLASAISGEDIGSRRNIFTDDVHTGQLNGSTVRFDYRDYYSYAFHPNLVELVDINGITVPNQVGDNYDYNKILLPLHNHDGNRQILFDLTDYVKAHDFKSLSIVVNDPISASYVDANGNIIYSYTREAKAQVSQPYVKYLGTNKQIVGHIKVLPDTTITIYDFYSYPAAFRQNPPSGDPILIHKSVSTFRRILITFSVSDTVATNLPPVFTAVPDTIKAYKDSVATFQFKAVDPEGDQIVYSVIGGHGATIDSTTGLFSYHSQQVGSFVFTVQASDGNGAAVDTFTVKVDNITAVDDHFSLPNKYELSQNYPNPFNPATTISFSLLKSGPASLKVYNLLGQEVALLVNEELSAGSHQVKFDASRLASGIYVYVLKANDFTATKKMILMK